MGTVVQPTSPLSKIKLTPKQKLRLSQPSTVKAIMDNPHRNPAQRRTSRR
jgi:hypothetical protein